uniref:Uncharacterized protein n=1 Tax=Clytia hemisphaerica TaxID=252671 RepID=A0A7M5XJY0_9CNID
MTSLHTPDIILPTSELNSIHETSFDDEQIECNRNRYDSLSSSDEEDFLSAKIAENTISQNIDITTKNTENVSNKIPKTNRNRKRVTLSGCRKVSMDGWVDINENVIEEQDETNENQTSEYGVSPKNSPKISYAANQRRTFGARRSFSTDGWVDQDIKDLADSKRFVYLSHSKVSFQRYINLW